MALLDNNGLRGGEPYYDMPQNTPLINYNGPTGLMMLMQMQPQVQTPQLKNDSGKLPNTLRGKLRGYINKENQIDAEIDQLNNSIYSSISQYRDFNEFQSKNPDKIQRLQSLVQEKETLKEDKINVENVKKEYDKKISTMDTNDSSGNIVYSNGQVMHKTIDPKNGQLTFKPSSTMTKDDPDYGLLTYGEYMTMVDEKDMTMDGVDFLPDIVNLNKKEGYGKKALNKIVSDAANKYNGAKWDNEGNLLNMKELPVDAGDNVSSSLAFLVTGGGSNRSNVNNIDIALNQVYNKKTKQYEFKGLNQIYNSLSPYEQKDLIDDYLRMAGTSTKGDGSALDLTPNITNQDFQAWIYDRMVTMANPLKSTETESRTGYNFLPSYNGARDKQIEKNTYGFVGQLEANNGLNTKPITDKYGNTTYQVTQPLSQLITSGINGNVLTTNLPLVKWSNPKMTMEFSNIAKEQMKNGSPIDITALGSDKFWLGTIQNDISDISNLGIKVWNASGEARQYVEPKYNYAGGKPSEGGKTEVLSTGHFDKNSPYYSGDNIVEGTTITVSVPAVNWDKFRESVYGLNDNISKIYKGDVDGFEDLAKTKNIKYGKTKVSFNGKEEDVYLVDIDIKLNASNSEIFDPVRYSDPQFKKKSDIKQENMFDNTINENYNRLKY